MRCIRGPFRIVGHAKSCADQCPVRLGGPLPTCRPHVLLERQAPPDVVDDDLRDLFQR